MPPRHLSDDELDLYAMRRFHALDRSEVDEHLLLCGECQRRLDAVESLMEALRLDRQQRKM